MTEAHQLVKLIEKLGHPSVSPLVNLNDENSLETKLCRHLENRPLSDEEAIDLLYGDPKKRDAFKMLKSRLKKKLYNQLFFLQHENINESRVEEINCNKILLQADILVLTGNFDLAEKQVKKGIKLAKKSGLTSSIVAGLEIYSKALSRGGRSLHLFDECQKELHEYYIILDYERKAASLFNEMSLKMRLGVSWRMEVLDQLEYVTVQLKEYWNKSGSSKLFWQYHKLKMIHFELTGNFLSQIDFIKETNTYYQKGLIKPEYFPLNFNKYALVYAYLRCKKYEEGITTALEFKSEVHNYSHNWFSNMENLFLLYVHSKQYKNAGDILKQVFNSQFFNKVIPYQHETWLLFANFYQLLAIESLPFNTKVKITANATIDKRGQHVWLIILNFLKLLKQENDELLYRDAERIRKYMGRYLDSKSDPRNKLFLKLLLLVVKEEFDPIRCKQKSRYLFNKLSQLSPAGDAYAEVEIVPFEHLWEFILNILENQKASIVKH